MSWFDPSHGLTSESPASFTVRPGIGGQLVTRVIRPGAARSGRPFTGTVEYENAGDADLVAPLLLVRGTSGTKQGDRFGISAAGGGETGTKDRQRLRPTRGVPAGRTATASQCSFTGKKNSGRAVSRILSAPPRGRGEAHLSQRPYPGPDPLSRAAARAAPRPPIWPCTRWGFPCPRACARSGGLLPHLFTLTRPPKKPGGLFSVALSVGRPRGHASRVYPARPGTGYAASRPAVFGLSSPGPTGSEPPPFQSSRPT